MLHHTHTHTSHMFKFGLAVQCSCLNLVYLLNVLMFITHAIHITTVLVCLVHAKFSWSSLYITHTTVLVYMLHLSTHTCTCTMLHVHSVLDVLFVCLNNAAHTSLHASHLHTQHTLSVCCQSCALLSVVCYITKSKKRAHWCKCFACAR